MYTRSWYRTNLRTDPEVPYKRLNPTTLATKLVNVIDTAAAAGDLGYQVKGFRGKHDSVCDQAPSLEMREELGCADQLSVSELNKIPGIPFS